MRYAELHREIGGISQKMLTQTLRSLERDGLVARKVYPVVPPRVEYSLTRLGRTLIEPLRGLCRWSEKHLAELQAHRARAKAKLAESHQVLPATRRAVRAAGALNAAENGNRSIRGLSSR